MYVVLVIGILLIVLSLHNKDLGDGVGGGRFRCNILDRLSKFPVIKLCVPKVGGKGYIKLNKLIHDNYMEKYLSVGSLRVIQVMSLIIFGFIALYSKKVMYYAGNFLKEIYGSFYSQADYNFDIRYKILIFVVAGIVGYLLPVYLVKLHGTRVRKRFERELPVIEVYIMMLLRSKIGMKDLLVEVAKVSGSFKSYFLEAAANYSVDNVRALERLAERVPDKEFRNTIKLLIRASTVNDTHVIDYLKRHLKTLKSREKIRNRKKAVLMENIASVNILVPLMLLVLWGLYPWLVYTLKIMRDI